MWTGGPWVQTSLSLPAIPISSLLPLDLSTPRYLGRYSQELQIRTQESVVPVLGSRRGECPSLTLTARGTLDEEKEACDDLLLLMSCVLRGAWLMFQGSTTWWQDAYALRSSC